MDGNAARVAARESGDEQVQISNSFGNVDPAAAGDSARHDKSGRLGQFVSSDLQLVAVGIAEIDRVRNFVTLEFEVDSALFQFALRCEKIFTVRSKSEMKYSEFPVTWRRRFCIRACGEQRNPSISFPDEGRHAVPHAFMKALEPENLDIPFHGSLDVAHAESYMINSFELHRKLRQNL